MTRDELKSWILAKLGHPVVNVELSDEALEICIDDALDEVNPWITDTKTITVPVSQCIDLSKYDVGTIVSVYKADEIDKTSNFDVFNPNFSTVSTTYNATYTELERMTYYQNLGYVKDNISYHFLNGKLYLDIGYPKSANVTIEYTESEEFMDVEDYTNRKYLKILKDFSLAFANEMLGEIRGKIRPSNSPVELDYDHKYSKSSDELERLRSLLKESFNPTLFITD